VTESKVTVDVEIACGLGSGAVLDHKTIRRRGPRGKGYIVLPGLCTGFEQVWGLDLG